MNRRILGLALPNIVTNITVPLLGLVDMIIVGHLSDPQVSSQAYLNALTVGSSIFSLIYWNFGFLRMGTSGLTAQAFGAERWKESIKILTCACTIALIIALLIIACQYPLAEAARIIYRSDPKAGGESMNLALNYFYVRIWAAPATLGLYAIKGWFIGMQDSKTPMWIAIIINLVNIVASLIFALKIPIEVFGKSFTIGFDWKIFGVALGTVVANYVGLFLAIFFLRRRIRKDHHLKIIKDIKEFKSFVLEALRWKEMRLFFKVNGDVFLRTLCLSAVFTFITAASRRIGEDICALDGILLMFFTLFSYIMDGFAYAGESLVGRHIGARQLRHLKLAVRLLIAWGLALTVIFTGLYAIWGDWILQKITNDQSLIAAAGDYMGWVLAIPICGFAAFLFDGIFIGATATRTMRNAMFVATAAFFAVYFGLKMLYIPDSANQPISQSVTQQWNNILWIAFMVFLTLRGLLQALRVRKDIYGQVSSL